MNVGVNFLREHVIPEARMHYAIINSGGLSPNVVQPAADVLYLLRAPVTSQVQEIYERVNDIAKGAALMTGTSVEIRFIKACSNTVLNSTLEKVLFDNLNQIPLPEYTPEDYAFAKAINNSVENRSPVFDKLIKKTDSEETIRFLREHEGRDINDFIVPLIHSEQPGGGSTDVGDVSWICPTAQISTATWASSTPGHSWQIVAQGKSELSHKSTLYAGKVMAGAAVDLLENPELLQKAKDEKAKKLNGAGYTCPIPKDVEPTPMGKM